MDSDEKQKVKVKLQEIVIDIHVKHLRLKVDSRVGVRVNWQRGKKQATTQVKTLKKDQNTAIFDEKFQINTVLQLDQNDKPLSEKISKLTVCTDRDSGSMHLADVEFDMTKFEYGKYCPMRLKLNTLESNTKYLFDREETYIDIALKGTKADGLVQRRMLELKEKRRGTQPTKIDLSPETKNGDDHVRNLSPSKILKSETYLKEVQKLQGEIKVLKKDNKSIKNDYEKKLNDKQTKINDILTELENQKTDIEHTNVLVDKFKKEKEINLQEKQEYLTKLDTEITERQKVSSQLQEKLGEQIRQKVELQELSQQKEQNEKQNEVNKVQLKQNLQVEQNRMKSFYDFDRFDISYYREGTDYLLAKKDIKNKSQSDFQNKKLNRK